jgi:hypothetical protein
LLNSNPSLKKIYGINITKSSRTDMMEMLQSDVNYRPEVFYASDLIKEISTLELNKNGKIEHAANCHDDVLFGYLIGRYAIKNVESTKDLLFKNKIKETFSYSLEENIRKNKNNDYSNILINNSSNIYSKFSNAILEENRKDSEKEVSKIEKGNKNVFSNFSKLLNMD